MTEIKTPKKLIEVALPLDAINAGCVEDKNRKTGHIRNLHKWFAPMPLPSWRALLFASLVDDPGNALPPKEAELERRRLLVLVERLAAFDSYKNRSLIKEVQKEILAATAGRPPTIVDPFCGGGSTVLEALRLGLTAKASDINPLPVLITTVLCRVPSLFCGLPPVNRPSEPAPIGGWRGVAGLLSDVRFYAAEVRKRAWARLAHLYPNYDGAMPYAYRWAWTVPSPDPTFQLQRTPLVANWWLSRHKGSRSWVQAVSRDGHIDYRIRADGAPPTGTVNKHGAVCLHSQAPIPLKHIRQCGRNGQLRQQMFALAVRGQTGSGYFIPDEVQLAAVTNTPTALPESLTVAMPAAALGFRVQQYGIDHFNMLFNNRQASALSVFADEVAAVAEEIAVAARNAGMSPDATSLEDGGRGAEAYADAVTAILGLCVGKMAQSNSILVRWFIDPRNGSGKATPAFERHAIPWVWDYAETNPFGGSVGDWMGAVLETSLRAFDLCVPESTAANVSRADARDSVCVLPGGGMIATDPPYYANIGYGDLSDFFYLWLRPALKGRFRSLFSTISAPKDGELIASPHRHPGRVQEANSYFRRGFADVFGEAARRLGSDYPMLVVYALKQSEEDGVKGKATGWEVFLEGLIEAGLVITATWPTRTTTATRLIGIGNNALASAIFVICRPRALSAAVTSKRDFMAALSDELPRAVAELQRSHIAPVDLAQAAIGPGMAVLTRYSSVLDAEGRPLSVRDALVLINKTLGDALDQQEGDFDPDTRWALAWFEQFGFSEGEFGRADDLARAKNTSVKGLEDAGLLLSARSKVRLLRPNELQEDWDPATDSRLTAWEVVHHLIRVLDSGGEDGAAALTNQLGPHADIGRDLAYRLYTLCHRKKWATEANTYNNLVVSWSGIASRTASNARGAATAKPRQQQLPGV